MCSRNFKFCFTYMVVNQLLNVYQLMELGMLLYKCVTVARHVWDQIQFLIIFAVFFGKKQRSFLTPLNERV